MRSRFSAFAKKEVGYLARTLHPDHEDRAVPEAELVRRLRDSAGASRFMGLTILDTAPPDGDGIARVLFFARVFQKGRERSFVELSRFAHDGDGWRYLAGDLQPIERIRGPVEALRIATFPG